jgi:Flp pilus assembly protein CpaB
MAQTAAATSRKRPGLPVLLAGVILMVVAFGVVVFLGNVTRPSGAATAKVSIIGAAHDIKTGKAITADDLATIDVDILPTGAIKAKEGAVGKIARQDIKAGLPILDSLLATPAVAAAGKLYFALPSGDVAINVPPTDISPYIQPGDQIDILAAPRAVGSSGGSVKTKIALKSIRVLAVGVPGTPTAGNLVVAVTPAEAEAIAFLVKNADFSYVLRSPLDANTPEQSTSGVDLPTFKSQYGY